MDDEETRICEEKAGGDRLVSECDCRCGEESASTKCANETMSKLRSAAYGRVKFKGKVAGGLTEGVTNVGVKLVQLAYLRPPVYGYDKATGRR